MEAKQIEPGNVVQLKSGGPKMTVEALDGSMAHCIYFNVRGSIVRVKFLAAIMAVVPESTK